MGANNAQPSPCIDALVDGAGSWSERCEWIGFDDEKTHLLEQMLRKRIDGLKDDE